MKKKSAIYLTVLVLVLSLVIAGCGNSAGVKTAEVPKPANPDLILATTTSTQDSGLLDVLIPVFEKKTGYKVKTIAVGSGAALTMGEKGEADVLLTHAPASEKKLVDNKAVIDYKLVMHNDFILVGPAADPAKVKDAKGIVEALKGIAESKTIFVSRGDDSGTDKAEKALCVKDALKPEGTWYQQSGTGMGQTLNIASEKQGYTLTDRATFLANKKNLKLEIVREGDASLLNIYHVMQVNPEKFPKVNKDGAMAFMEFMISSETQKQVGEFGKEKYGQALFFPDAGKAEGDLK